MFLHRSHRNFIFSACNHWNHLKGSSGWICWHSNWIMPHSDPSVFDSGHKCIRQPGAKHRAALFAGGAYLSELWLFWLAPMLGAALAGAVGRWRPKLNDTPRT